ncbi:unnamed protein product, partial [Mesorhabditis spiculigera]
MGLILARSWAQLVVNIEQNYKCYGGSYYSPNNLEPVLFWVWNASLLDASKYTSYVAKVLFILACLMDITTCYQLWSMKQVSLGEKNIDLHVIRMIVATHVPDIFYICFNIFWPYLKFIHYPLTNYLANEVPRFLDNVLHAAILIYFNQPTRVASISTMQTKL